MLSGDIGSKIWILEVVAFTSIDNNVEAEL